MVNSIANLNISVSNLFVNIMDMFVAEITRVVDNNQQPTYKLALVSLIFQSRPIFPLLFSRKTRTGNIGLLWERRQGYASLMST